MVQVFKATLWQRADLTQFGGNNECILCSVLCECELLWSSFLMRMEMNTFIRLTTRYYVSKAILNWSSKDSISSSQLQLGSYYLIEFTATHCYPLGYI